MIAEWTTWICYVGAAGIVCFIVLFIGQLIARPAQMHPELQAEIKQLKTQADETAKDWLEIAFDPERDRQDLPGTTLFCVRVRNKGPESIPRVSVGIRHIAPLEKKRERRKEVHRLSHRHLRPLRDERVPGPTEFELDSYATKPIKLVEYKHNADVMRVWAIGRPGRLAAAHVPFLAIVMKPEPFYIPVGRYDISIFAHGQDVVGCERTFRISFPRGKLAFRPLPAAGPGVPS